MLICVYREKIYYCEGCFWKIFLEWKLVREEEDGMVGEVE